MGEGNEMIITVDGVDVVKVVDGELQTIDPEDDQVLRVSMEEAVQAIQDMAEKMVLTLEEVVFPEVAEWCWEIDLIADLELADAIQRSGEVAEWRTGIYSVVSVVWGEDLFVVGHENGPLETWLMDNEGNVTEKRFLKGNWEG